MRRLLLLSFLILAPELAFAQISTVNGKLEQLPITLGSAGGMKVECIVGCVPGGGTTETDDNSVANGQVIGLSINLPYGYDSTAGVWKRISLFGLANSQPQAVAIVDGSGNQITSFGGGTQYVNGVANAGPTGTLSLGYDGANLRAIKTDNTGQVAVTGTFWQVTQPVSGTFWPTLANAPSSTRLSDGAAFYDARSIRALTSADVITVNNSFLLDATFTGRINTLGQKTMANSTPVVIASDQSTITVAIGGVSPLAADNSGTPSVINVGAYEMYYDGTSFYRTRGDASGSWAQIRFGGATIDPRSIRALTNADVVKAQLQDNAGNALVSANGAATVGTERGLVNTPNIPPRTNTANLTAACSAANIDSCGAGSTVEIIIGGYNGVAVALTNTGFATTMAVDWTINGTHWVATVFVINATTGTATVPASGKDLQVVIAAGTTSVDMATAIPAGAQKARIRLQVLTTTGTTLTAFISANTNSDIYGLNLSGQTAGKAAGAAIPTLIGGADGTTGCSLLGVAAFPCIQNLNVTAKAVQGSFGAVTQDFKDTGRSSAMITLSVASTQTAELLVTITKSLALAATTTCSSCSITTGKRFRIQTITASARNSTGTVTGNVTLKIRAAVGGATSTASPLQWSSTVNIPASAVSVLFPDAHIPDGFEIDSNGATNTWGITITDPHWVTGAQVTTFDLSLIGYEY
jgi:hypothetical protein